MVYHHNKNNTGLQPEPNKGHETATDLSLQF